MLINEQQISSLRCMHTMRLSLPMVQEILSSSMRAKGPSPFEDVIVTRTMIMYCDGTL